MKGETKRGLNKHIGKAKWLWRRGQKEKQAQNVIKIMLKKMRPPHWPSTGAKAVGSKKEEDFDLIDQCRA